VTQHRDESTVVRKKKGAKESFFKGGFSKWGGERGIPIIETRFQGEKENLGLTATAGADI